jgi:WD40 repeat protein
LSFSPFHDNLLATASSDGTVKIWAIPEGGIKSNTSNFDCDLRGHSKKVMLLQFNPCTEFTLATAGMEGSVKIWDIQNEQAQFSYDNLGGVPWCMQWNQSGS